MKLTIGNEGRYNFHNVSDLAILVKEENKIMSKDGETLLGVYLTPSQTKRIEKHFCGMSDCCCGSAPKGWESMNDDKTAIIHLREDNRWAEGD